MVILFITILLLSLFVGVSYKAKNPQADLASCVMDGFMAFLSDIKLVLSSIKKKDDAAVESDQTEVLKSDEESEDLNKN